MIEDQEISRIGRFTEGISLKKLIEIQKEFADTTPKIEVLYFGCWEKRYKGHYLHRPDGWKFPHASKAGPWQKDLDGGLAPHDTKQVEFRAVLHHKFGWTALAFWDRTADERTGSNSAFIISALVSFETAVELFKQFFPQQYNRLPEMLREVEA